MLTITYAVTYGIGKKKRGTGCIFQTCVVFSVAKATLESQMSVCPSVCPSVRPSVTETPQPLRIAPIVHQAYRPSSILTIKSIDHQAYKPLVFFRDF